VSIRDFLISDIRHRGKMPSGLSESFRDFDQLVREAVGAFPFKASSIFA